MKQHALMADKLQFFRSIDEKKTICKQIEIFGHFKGPTLIKCEQIYSLVFNVLIPENRNLELVVGSHELLGSKETSKHTQFNFFSRFFSCVRTFNSIIGFDKSGQFLLAFDI